MWRVPEPFLEQAQDDATVVAIRDMERAGIDIITDGEIRRESYSNRFATALDGVDVENPGVIRNRTGQEIAVPRVVGRIQRKQAVEVRDMQFLRRNTDRPAKITLPGPFTLAQQARNEFYRDAEEMAMDFAAAVNAEARDLQAAGADVIQLDEPWLRNDPEAAKRYAVPAINRALAGITVPTALHLCFGYAAVMRQQKPTGYSFLPQLAETIAEQISIEAAQPRLDLGVLADLAGKTIILGVIDLGDPAVETAEQVAARIRAGLTRVPPDAAHPGARLRHEVSPPRHGLRKAQRPQRRRARRPLRALRVDAVPERDAPSTPGALEHSEPGLVSPPGPPVGTSRRAPAAPGRAERGGHGGPVRGPPSQSVRLAPAVVVHDVGQRPAADGAELPHGVADGQDGVGVDAGRQAQRGLRVLLVEEMAGGQGRPESERARRQQHVLHGRIDGGAGRARRAWPCPRRDRPRSTPGPRESGR